MCHLRAYRHNCGHTTHRAVSSCRFTYVSPTLADKPLCHATAELVVRISGCCQQCQYNAFCQTWETRIAEARAKQGAARMLLRDMLQEDDDWAAGEWGGGSNDGDGGAGGNSYWGAESGGGGELGFGGSDVYGLGFGNDTSGARRERDRADQLVESLWSQYQREQWTVWRFFVSGPSRETESASKRSWRRRKTSRRCSGDSPLKHVISMSNNDADAASGEGGGDGYGVCWEFEGNREDAPSPSSEISGGSEESEGSDQGATSRFSRSAAKGGGGDGDGWSGWAWPGPPSPSPSGGYNPVARLTNRVGNLTLDLATGRTESSAMSPISPGTWKWPAGDDSTWREEIIDAAVNDEYDDDEFGGPGARVEGRYRHRNSRDDGIRKLLSATSCSSPSSESYGDLQLPDWGMA